MVRSVEWADGGVVKSRESFAEHLEDEQLKLLLTECAGRGVVRPSSYGDMFHQRNFQPPTRAAHRKMFPGGTVPGGWNAVGLHTRIREPVWKYDVRSAYLWSLAQGLPHPRTFRTVRRVNGPGVYWCPSPCHPLLPHPWNKPGYYPATEDELLALPLDVSAIEYGVSFEPGTFDVSPWCQDIQAWSCYKAVGRSFWGRWISSGNAVAETIKPNGELATARELPDNRRNPIWGAIITSRLRLRLWRLWDSGDRRSFRVFTDSIVTDQELPTGDSIGDWKEEAYYPHGAIIQLQGIKPLSRAA